MLVYPWNLTFLCNSGFQSVVFPAGVQFGWHGSWGGALAFSWGKQRCQVPCNEQDSPRQQIIVLIFQISCHL